MPVYIEDIATAVPDTYFQQSAMRDQMKKYVSKRPATERIIHSIYTNSGIDKRHTVVDDFHANGRGHTFFKEDGTLGSPSTKMRNEIYTTHAKKLFVEIGQTLLRANPCVDKRSITHVITVSCTGFFAPGPAYEIVENLGLSPDTQRFHVGFMGCYAMFPALKMARSFCVSNPEARVLIVSVELCTLHLQDSDETDQLISASVFADGAAGALVSAQEPTSGPGYRLEHFESSIAEQSKQDMAWTIGNTGFDMVLSTYVPDIIEANLAEALAPLLEHAKMKSEDIVHWAVHPGGRAILDKVEKSFSLESSQIEAARRTLANYGNMSSATILFVLKDLLEQPSNDAEASTLSIAFGPGLTIESALLTKLS